MNGKIAKSQLSLTSLIPKDKNLSTMHHNEDKDPETGGTQKTG